MREGAKYSILAVKSTENTLKSGILAVKFPPFPEETILVYSFVHFTVFQATEAPKYGIFTVKSTPFLRDKILITWALTIPRCTSGMWLWAISDLVLEEDVPCLFEASSDLTAR